MLGGCLTLVVMAPVLFWISDLYMRIAAMILNEKVAWPQINFMSAYPDDVRNGYLLFVLATLTTVLLSSGVIAGLIGASVGKRILGIRYHIYNSDKPAGFGRMLYRAFLLCCVLTPCLLLGPILGFVFGEAADLYSLVALLAGTVLLLVLAVVPSNSTNGLTWVTHKAGLRPVILVDKGA